MPYTADRPIPAPTAEELRARIPGWGADLDPANRPSIPKERFDPAATGAHWTFPDRQLVTGDRERSIEHELLPPVFGTAQPLRGLSGRIRRRAYDRYSEARLAHWLLLILGDRVESTGAHLRSLLTLRPDNPVSETGVLSERRRHPIRSRVGRGRADTAHSWLDPIIVAGPWLLVGAVAVGLIRAVVRRAS